MPFDAIVLADAATASVKVAGLAVRDRATRIAQRLGARRTLVVDSDRAQIASWREGDLPLLVIRADQLVHTPLVAPLVAAPPPSGVAIAVGPDGEYGGALLAASDVAARVATELAAGTSDSDLATTAETKIPHGEIARHPVGTEQERRGAHELLYRLLVKPQDNAITRYLFRPISSRISRLLLRTPITATQVSLVVAALVGLGCWMTLDASTEMMIGGALVILWATYLDCCDGEIARVKLQASTFGAWLDTIVDELSSIAYMLCIGWHCHVSYGRNYFGDLGFDPWIAGMWIGLGTFTWSLIGIYYNIIVGVGSANSQDYTARFIIVPGSHPGAFKLAPKPPVVRDWGALKPVVDFLPNIVRRDFIVWLAAVYAVLRVPHLSFATHLAGGIVSSIVVTFDHLHLRAVSREARRRGSLEPPK